MYHSRIVAKFACLLFFISFAIHAEEGNILTTLNDDPAYTSRIESLKKKVLNFAKQDEVKSPFVGFYGGLMAGVVQTNSTLSASSSVLPESQVGLRNNQDLVQHDIPVYSNQIIGALYIGYGEFINDNNFFLAGEITGNIANRKNSLENFANTYIVNIDNHSIKSNTIISLWQGEFDFDLRPGYPLGKNLLTYGRFGLAVNQLNMTTKNNFLFTHFAAPNEPDDETITYSSSLKKEEQHTVTGFRIGGGLEYHLYENFAVTADYIYTYYGKINTYGKANVLSDQRIPTVAPTSITSDWLIGKASGQLSTQAILLGAKYYL